MNEIGKHANYNFDSEKINQPKHYYFRDFYFPLFDVLLYDCHTEIIQSLIKMKRHTTNQ